MAPPSSVAPAAPVPAAPPGNPSGNGQPSVAARAFDAAATASKGAGPAPVNKGGRRPVADEAREWAARNGLRLVPAAPAPQVVGSGTGDGLPGYVPDPAFVARMASGLLKTLDGLIQGAVFRRVCRLTKAIFGRADTEEARECATAAGAPPGCLDVMSQAAAELAQKYGLAGEWSPEAAFVGGALMWAGNVVELFRRLDKLGAEAEAARKAGTPTAPPPNGSKAASPGAS